jgi:hypothetical protein
VATESYEETRTEMEAVMKRDPEIVEMYLCRSSQRGFDNFIEGLVHGGSDEQALRDFRAAKCEDD